MGATRNRRAIRETVFPPLCNFEQRIGYVAANLTPVTLHAELRRLQLRIERALLARRQLRSLLTEADVALAAYRRELRNLQARVARGAAMMQRQPRKERLS